MIFKSFSIVLVRQFTKFFFLLAVLSLAVSQFSACKRKSSQSSDYADDSKGLTPVRNDWMVNWIAANPTTLNPVLGTDVYSKQITSVVFDTLTRYNIETGEPTGNAAESWTVSKDGLTYEFKLRPNMFFHDGRPVTAEDVKFSFDLIKDPKVGAAHLQNYFKDLDKVEIVNASTVRVKMKSAYFRNLIMLGLLEILPKHVYGKGDFNKNPANRKPVGSGPYVFSKWDEGRLVELKRNTKYWGDQVDEIKEHHNFHRLLFRVINETSVAVMALKKGEIDTMSPTFSQYLNDLKGADVEKNYYRLQYETEDGGGYSYLAFNLRRPVFQSKEVRRALAHLMPREEINKKLWQSLRTPAVSIYPRRSAKTDSSIQPIEFSPDKAREILAKEGWIDSDRDGVLEKDKKRFSFELLFPPGNSDYERIALIFQQTLKEAGIEMNIRTLEWSVFLKQISTPNWDAKMLSWGASLDGDPYQVWHSSQAAAGSNRGGYKNAKADELMEKARVELNRDKRNEMYRELSKIISDETPYIFMFEVPQLNVTTKRFKRVLPPGKLGLDSARWFTPLGKEKYKEQEAAH